MDMLSDKYTTVLNRSCVEYEEKRSVFIGHALRCESEEDALSFIKSIKKEYADATHNCFGYLLKGGVLARYSDDGEPQGTAGLPILEAIRKSGASDVCVVVTRYFGGTLLGAGGLVRAYSHSAALAVSEAKLVTYEPYSQYRLVSGYSEYQKYSNILSSVSAVIDSTEFGANVTVDFAVKRDDARGLLKRISEAGFGRDIPEYKGERFDFR